MGTTNQKGYKFDYQSTRGSGCRTYRLRNAPGSVLTPAVWKDADEVFLDVDLPACPVGTNCGWVNVVKISGSAKSPGETILSYGVNKDECKDDPDAFRRERNTSGSLSKLITEIRGLVADSKGQPRPIAIKVSSMAMGNPKDGYVIVYRMETSGWSEPFELMETQKSQEGESSFRVLWQAAASKPFNDLLQDKYSNYSLQEGPGISVELRTPAISVDERNQLVIFQGEKRIVATTAPAYRPKE